MNAGKSKLKNRIALQQGYQNYQRESHISFAYLQHVLKRKAGDKSMSGKYLIDSTSMDTNKFLNSHYMEKIKYLLNYRYEFDLA